MKLSVGIITFNEERIIAKTIDAVKNIAEAGDSGKPYIQNESEASIRLNKIIDQILDKVK